MRKQKPMYIKTGKTVSGCQVVRSEGEEWISEYKNHKGNECLKFKIQRLLNKVILL